MLPFIQIAKVFEISTKIINNIFLLLQIFGFINPNFLGFRIRINDKKKSEIPRIIGFRIRIRIDNPGFIYTLH